MSDTVIATVLAERGKKYDETQECISSYNRSIVFLPRSVQPGEVVRVHLIPIPDKTDVNGRVMYRAEMAPPELSPMYQQQIASEASQLRQLVSFSGQEGETVLRAQQGSLKSEWTGYDWYYFDDDGSVYATKFSPAALAVLEALPQAKDSGLCELTAWILSGPRSSSNDFYQQQQTGEVSWHNVPDISAKDVSELIDRLVNGESVLAAILVAAKSFTVEEAESAVFGSL